MLGRGLEAHSSDVIGGVWAKGIPFYSYSYLLIQLIPFYEYSYLLIKSVLFNIGYSISYVKLIVVATLV